MKPSKKLMRDFAKVVGLTHIAGEGGIQYALKEWRTVFNMVQKWCKIKNVHLVISLSKCATAWYVGTQHGGEEHKHLPTAIMKAVVAAAKSEV